MKTHIKKLALIIFLTVAFCYTNAPCATPYTLTSWAQLCLENLPENSDTYKTVLTSKKFEEKTQELIQKYKSMLIQEKIISNSATSPYAQKLCLNNPEDEICLIGDLHGSLHALLVTLLNLAFDPKKYINNNFSLKNNFYLVFLGDYIDRGHYGTEVWFTLMLLKLAPGNWDKVILIRGNHENRDMATQGGFNQELTQKFKNRWYHYLLNLFLPCLRRPSIIYTVFDYLPSTLFIQYNQKMYQCCHGGLSQNYHPKDFLLSNKRFKRINTNTAHDLCWGDFYYGQHPQEIAFIPNRNRFNCSKEDASKIVDYYTKHKSWPPEIPLYAYKNAVEDYLKNNNISAIFRG
ncbi:MAG: metallophosphoesterase family protein, partial [bacterium]